MTEHFKKKGDVYKAEALLPPMPKKDMGGGYGDSGLPPQDWNDDPLLKEKPREAADTDVSVGRTVDAHPENDKPGEPLTTGETPDMAADEVKAEWERHKKRPTLKNGGRASEMRRGGPKSGI